MSGKNGIFHKIRNLFDQTPSNVPMNKRFGAYVADWALGGIFCGLPAVFMYGGVTGKSDMFSNLYIFESLGFDRMWGILAGLLCILFALFYYVYVPWKIYPGQTIGKKWAGLRIARVDGRQVGLKELLLRQAFAIFLLEGSMFIISGYIRQTITLITRFYVDVYWQYLAIVITFVSLLMVVYTQSHRAIHDYIAKTKVVLATASIISKKENKEPELEIKKPQKELKQEPVKTSAPKQRLPKKSKTRK